MAPVVKLGCHWLKIFVAADLYASSTKIHLEQQQFFLD